MIKGPRTKLVEKLYKSEIKFFGFEIYIASDEVPHIRTFAVLNDTFDTKIKLEELGPVTDYLLDELEDASYIPSNIEEYLKILKK